MDKPKNPHEQYITRSISPYYAWNEGLGAAWQEVERLEAELKDLKVDLALNDRLRTLARRIDRALKVFNEDCVFCGLKDKALRGGD